MDKLVVLTAFLHAIVVYNIPLLYGTVGEIIVENPAASIWAWKALWR